MSSTSKYFCDVCKKEVKDSILLHNIPKFLSKHNYLNMEVCDDCLKKMWEAVETI
jgi:hypothetical protein